MVQIPGNHQEALDIVWAAYCCQYDAWKHVFPDTKGATRADLVGQLGWSYATVNRLTHELLDLGQLAVTWNHQHQSYWEGQFKPVREEK